MQNDVSLVDVINEAINELDPEYVDNPDDSEDEDLVDLESDDDDEEDDVEDDDDTDDETDSEEDSEKIVVKVDGEELEVTIDELKAGYSRQAHFTRKMQELKEERTSFESEVQEVQGSLDQLAQLDQAWEESPVDVLTQLISSTDNPSYALGILIRNMAVQNMLPQEALEYFGIDSSSKESWTKEDEVQRLRSELQSRERLDAEQNSKQVVSAQEARVSEAMTVLERQIVEIVAEEDMEFANPRQEAKFRAELLTYAKDSGITDLKKAYAALSYEKAKASRSRKVNGNSATKKTNSQVVGRRSAGRDSVVPVQDSSLDLRSVIEQTMKEMEIR